MEQVNTWLIHITTTEVPADLPEEQASQSSVRVVAARSKAKAEPQKREPVDVPNIIPMNERKWIDFEPGESSLSAYCQSHSTLPHDTTRRWRSSSILENQVLSSESISTKPMLVGWSLENMLGIRRRIQKKISVLLWWFGKNYLPPCSSGTLWKQSYWSYVTGQCSDCEWNFPLHLPHRMRVQSSFYYQQWIDSWRSRFEQKTDSILLAHWSKRRKSQRSWTYWLLCTTSSAICAQCMEEVSRRGILGWYWSCDQRRINILSNTIECNYCSRNTSSPLFFKSWKIENWRSCMKDNIRLLDHHQRSLWNTITNGLKEMINRVLQLNISQLEKSFNSQLETHFQLDLPSQPNPNLIQLKIERRNLWKMKIIASWMFTIERRNLWKKARTKCKKLVLSNIVILHRQTRTSSTLQ